MADSIEPTAAARPPVGPGGAARILGAIGVVFGDIGTSPLYTLQECLHSRHGVAPRPENVLGVVSLIVWSVTMVVTVKYLGFMMRADNKGEGGIMALLALALPKASPARVGRVGWIAILAVLGAALLYGDGIITPAISVLSAVEGLQVATNAFRPYVVPLTVAILIALFFFQRRGTGKIGKLFGPVMVTWFATIGALGLYHVARQPAILGALSPHHGVRFFIDNGASGFRVLGGVVLAVTGGEALYADMGQFGRRPIRRAWLGLIYPALLLCYMGQGAALLTDPSGAERPFYALIPRGPWIYPAVILASAATVIASQALVSGVFSITHQAIRLGYFPEVAVRHTSGQAEGQTYVPLLNWSLALACIALVVIFRQSSGLAAAYGLAVSGTMAITSIVYYKVVRHAWGWSRPRSIGVLLLFLSFDIPFVLANGLKFFDGGYLPCLVGAAFAWVMLTWRIGCSYLADAVGKESIPVAAFIDHLVSENPTRLSGTAVVLSDSATGVPPALLRLVQRFHVVHQHVVLLTVVTEHVPFVPNSGRATVEQLGGGLVRVLLHYGFMQVPRVPAALGPTLAKHGIAGNPGEITYIIGRETLVAARQGHMGRLTEPLFAFLARNARSTTDHFWIPVEQVVEVGIQLDL